MFFADTLKFFLSLYGHKLPVLSLDISSDGALLASGSADKNLKIWGMDFGDCHRSLFAHQDSVMQVPQLSPKMLVAFTRNWRFQGSSSVFRSFVRRYQIQLMKEFSRFPLIGYPFLASV